jgi:hypothetical protein
MNYPHRRMTPSTHALGTLSLSYGKYINIDLKINTNKNVTNINTSIIHNKKNIHSMKETISLTPVNGVVQHKYPITKEKLISGKKYLLHLIVHNTPTDYFKINHYFTLP